MNDSTPPSQNGSLFLYLVGWLLILMTIMYWLWGQASYAPTIVNKIEVLDHWALASHLVITGLGLVLILASSYSGKIGEAISKNFYNEVKYLFERSITAPSKPKTTKNPKASFMRVIKIALIVTLTVSIIGVLLSLMYDQIVINSFEIILITFLLPLLLIVLKVRQLGQGDFKVFLDTEKKAKDFDFTTRAILKVLDNQVAYINEGERFELVRSGKFIEVEGTSARVFNYSYFSLKKHLKLSDDSKSNNGGLSMTVEIAPEFVNFPPVISDQNFYFIQLFLNSQQQEDKLRTIIPNDLIQKAIAVKNELFLKIQALYMETDKNEADVTEITKGIYDRSPYQEISQQIQAPIARYFNEKFGAVKEAFSVLVTIDDLMERQSLINDIKVKVEAHIRAMRLKKEEEIRRKILLEEEREKEDRRFKKDLALSMVNLFQKMIEKGTMAPRSQENLMNLAEQIITQSPKPLHGSALADYAMSEARLEGYSEELVEAQNFFLSNKLTSAESQIQYLQTKTFFKDYPNIKPRDVYAKIVQLEGIERKEKIKAALKELLQPYK